MVMNIEIMETFGDYTALTTGNAPFNAHWILTHSGNFAFAASAFDASDRVFRLGGTEVFFSSNALRMFAVPVTKVTISIAIAVTDLTEIDPPYRLLDSVGNSQLTLHMTTTGKLVIEGEGGVALATSQTNLTTATIYRLCWRVEMLGANSVSVKCSINGYDDPGLTVTADFQDQAETTLSGFAFHMPPDNTQDNGSQECLHLMIGTGECVDWGPIELVDYLPNIDIVKQWTRSAGADNFANVDEAQGNGDTDYNSSETITNKDVFGFADGEVPERLICVGLVSWGRKEDSATRKFKQVLRVAGVDYYGADIFAAETYGRFLDTFELNPATGLAWDPAALNGLEAGYEYIGA